MSAWNGFEARKLIFRPTAAPHWSLLCRCRWYRVHLPQNSLHQWCDHAHTNHDLLCKWWPLSRYERQ